MILSSIESAFPEREPGAQIAFVPLGWNASSFYHEGIRLWVDGMVALDDGGFQKAADRGPSESFRQIIDLYRKDGPGFLKRLRGSFALALCDAKINRLILAADPFATRPLYYWAGKSMVAFALKISSLASRSEVPARIDSNSLYCYLNHSCIPAPFTIYQDIRRVEPGQYLSSEAGKLSLVQYWDMAYPENRRLSERAAAELLRSSVEESLRFLLGSEAHRGAEIGAFLSGGTDSSTVVGLASQIRNEPIQTFSVGFEEQAYNEIHYARVAAGHFKSRAHEYFVRPGEALNALASIAQQFDEPFGNSSAIPTYFCLKMAREAGVKVMFSGDGGDELYGGNERYLTEKVFWYYHRIPVWLRRGTDVAVEWLPAIYPWGKLKNYVRKANLPAMDRYLSYQMYLREHAGEFFTADFKQSLDLDFPLSLAHKHYQRAGNISPLNRLLYVDLKLTIADNDLFKVNRMAESQGVQVRYPFLDTRVALASGKIPAELKLKGWNKRYIFKKAFEHLLPQEILRKKKHGFGLPTGDWLRSDPGFRDLARALLLDSRSVQRGYFKRSALEQLLRMHDEEASSYYGSHIWNFMMLELWHRNHADKASSA